MTSAHQLLLLLYSFIIVITQAQAADVTSTSGLLAYSTLACPTGWKNVGNTSTSTTYAGRVIVGATSGIGNTIGTALTSDNSIPSHVHSSWSMVSPITWGMISAGVWPDAFHMDINYPYTSVPLYRPSLPPSYETCPSASPCIFDSPVNKWNVADQTLSQSNTAMTSVTSKIPLVTLNLCQFISGASFNIPVGVVVFFSASTTTCPSGFTDFVDATGRVMIFADSSTSVTSNNIGGGSAILAGKPLGEHSHTIQPVTINVPFTFLSGFFLTFDSPNIDGLAPAGYHSTATFTASNPTSSDGLLSHTQLRACQANSMGSGIGREPPSDMIFYYDGNTCPGYWRDVSQVSGMNNLTGRIPIVRSTSWTNPTLTLVGGIQDMLNVTATDAMTVYNYTHDHIISGASVSLPSLTDWCGYFPMENKIHCGHSDASGVKIPVATGLSISTKTNTQIPPQIPYRIMRGCMPPLPTQSPTVSPSTSRPSVTPTTSTPSKSPTTSKPSNSPSRVPSKNPSKAPTTSKPSRAPSKSPSKSPSHTPSTSKPSRSPSKSPSKSPSHTPSTSYPSTSPSVSPTAVSPSNSPSLSPTLSHPSVTPSITPTLSHPSKSPTTLHPSHSPSKSPSHDRAGPAAKVAAAEAAEKAAQELTATVGGVVGGVAVLFVGVAVGIWWIRSSRKQNIIRDNTNYGGDAGGNGQGLIPFPFGIDDA
jgi:hypothetical protein